MTNPTIMKWAISDLPSMPIVIQRLQAALVERDINISEVASIIETDQAFTARVLRLVNSPFYGLTQKISSVEAAITILGFDAVNQLLLTTSVLTSFSDRISGFNISDFWKHSFGVGVIAKHLLLKFSREDRSFGFICGILHDIGRLLLVKIDREKYITFYSRSKMLTDLVAEEECFEIDHQVLGQLICRRWNFPDNLIEVIANHHTPLLAGKNLNIASAVNVADILCHAFQVGDSSSYYVSQFFPNAWKTLNVNMKELEDILGKSLVEIDGIENVIRMVEQV